MKNIIDDEEFYNEGDFSPDGLYDRRLAKKFLEIFSNYKFFDLCRAVFCVNAWRFNRKHLNFYLTLNYTLTKCKAIGNKPIDTYCEFVVFFNKIKPYLNSQFDDDIVPDFGEIQISFNECFYPVFLGTGHNYVYPMMQSLYSLSNYFGIASRIQEVLIYVKNMVDSLSSTNKFTDEKDLSSLDLPKEEFFEKCMQWYEEIELLDSSALNLLVSSSKNKLEKTHFINFEGKYLPLFNPSIIIDSFENLFSNLQLNNDKLTEAADFAVYAAIKNNFALEPKHRNLFLQVGIVEDLKNKKVAEQLLFDFALVDVQSILFLINENSVHNKNLHKAIEIGNMLIKQNKLNIVEFDGNGRCCIVNLSLCKELEIIVYDNKIDLKGGMKLGEENQILSYFLYDLITIIYRATSISDIVGYLKYKREANWRYFGFSGNSAVFEAWVNQKKELMQGAYNANQITTDVYLVEWDVFNEYLEFNKWYPFKNYCSVFSNPSCWIIDKNYNENFLMITNKAIFGYGGFFRKINDSYQF